MSLEASIEELTAAVQRLSGLLQRYEVPPQEPNSEVSAVVPEATPEVAVHDPEPAPTTATYETLCDTVLDLVNPSRGNDKPAAVEILARYGAKRASDVPEAKWGEVQAELSAALAATEWGAPEAGSAQ